MYGDGSIRVKQVADLDPQQEEENGIGILNTIFTGNVGPTTTRGLLIDAGSGGSRIHLYEWGPRVFKQVPPRLLFPRRMNYLLVELVPECSLHGGRTRQRKI